MPAAAAETGGGKRGDARCDHCKKRKKKCNGGHPACAKNAMRPSNIEPSIERSIDPEADLCGEAQGARRNAVPPASPSSVHMDAGADVPVSSIVDAGMPPRGRRLLDTTAEGTDAAPGSGGTGGGKRGVARCGHCASSAHARAGMRISL